MWAGPERPFGLRDSVLRSARGGERGVVGSFQEQVEFRAVELEPIDLAVFKFESADDRFRHVEVACGCSEWVVCAKRAVRLKPVLQRSRGDLDMRFAAHDALGIGQGVAQVEGGDCVEDDFEWIALVLARSSGCEVVKAFGAFISGLSRYPILRVEVSGFSRDSGIGCFVSCEGESRVGMRGFAV